MRIFTFGYVVLVCCSLQKSLLADGATGSAAPYVSSFYREKAETTRHFEININDLYVGAKWPYSETPFMQLKDKKKSKCARDPFFWTDNISCEVSSFKQLGLPSVLKKGGPVWLFAPGFIFRGKIQSIRATTPDDVNHAVLSVEVASEKPMPRYAGYYGVLLESEPPPQTYQSEDLSKIVRATLLALAKKKGLLKAGEMRGPGSLIKTKLGSFAFIDFQMAPYGDTDQVDTFVFKESEAGDWSLSEKFRDQGTILFGDIDGDGVPELASNTGYKGINIRKIHPEIQILRSGSSGT